MISQMQSSASWTDTLKARKNHLIGLMKILDMQTGKASKVQTLTVNLIKNEITLIDAKLKSRK
ncbi:hypothetical protein M2426_000749 [Pseudomonas moraviensis]